MSEIIKFFKQVEKSIIDIKKVDKETNSYIPDMLMFLNKDTEKFLINNKQELQKLFDLRLPKDLVSFITRNIWDK